MHILLKYLGSTVVASTLAVILTVYVFQMPLESAVETGLMAGVIALVIVYMNTRQGDTTTTTPRDRS